MAYKDKDKQREADRERQRRYRRDANLRRDKQGVTDLGRDKGVTVIPKGVTIVDESQSVMIPVIPKSESHVDVSTISAVKTLHALCDKAEGVTIQGITQIPKEQMCITDDWQAAADEPPNTKPKRGKDIKTFADLPPDIQMTINRMSGHDKAEHIRRTAIAIHYQTCCFGPQGM